MHNRLFLLLSKSFAETTNIHVVQLRAYVYNGPSEDIQAQHNHDTSSKAVVATKPVDCMILISKTHSRHKNSLPHNPRQQYASFLNDLSYLFAFIASSAPHSGLAIIHPFNRLCSLNPERKGSRTYTSDTTGAQTGVLVYIRYPC